MTLTLTWRGALQRWGGRATPAFGTCRRGPSWALVRVRVRVSARARVGVRGWARARVGVRVRVKG